MIKILMLLVIIEYIVFLPLEFIGSSKNNCNFTRILFITQQYQAQPFYLSTSIATLTAPSAPDSANSKASLDLDNGNLCVINGFTLTAP